MKRLVLVGVLVATTAMAQAIGGTLTASYLNSNNGISQVQIDVNLTCTLTCDTSAPVKHFAIVAGIYSHYASAVMETAGYSAFLSTDLDLDGQASVLSSNFKAGQTVFLKATSATCHCGNRNGEGGFIDLTTPSFSIPAFINTQTSVRVGDQTFLSAAADLRGSEQVELKVEGGGLNESRLFGVAELSSGYARYPLTFTTPGTATVTATLRPSGVASSATWAIVARPSATGGGGGSSSTGGGAGGGGATEPMGCNAIGGPSLLLLALALARRRRAQGRFTSPC